MSLGDAIEAYAVALVVTRHAPATRVLGRGVAGSTSTINLTASVQPVTGRDLKTLPEGRHATDCRKLISVTELKVTDTVTLNGDVFEVYKVKQWTDGLDESDRYYRAFASRRPVP